MQLSAPEYVFAGQELLKGLAESYTFHFQRSDLKHVSGNVSPVWIYTYCMVMQKLQKYYIKLKYINYPDVFLGGSRDAKHSPSGTVEILDWKVK